MTSTACRAMMTLAFVAACFRIDAVQRSTAPPGGAGAVERRRVGADERRAADDEGGWDAVSDEVPRHDRVAVHSSDTWARRERYAVHRHLVAACLVVGAMWWWAAKRRGSDAERLAHVRAARASVLDALPSPPTTRKEASPPRTDERKRTRATHSRYLPVAAYDPFSPERHFAEARHVDRTLRLTERLMIKGGDGRWQPALATVDTGNAAITLVDADFAAQHGLVGGVFGKVEGQRRIRGVTGEEELVDVVTLELEIKGRVHVQKVGITRLRTSTSVGKNPVLLGMDVIEKLLDAGYVIGADSLGAA